MPNSHRNGSRRAEWESLWDRFIDFQITPQSLPELQNNHAELMNEIRELRSRFPNSTTLKVWEASFLFKGGERFADHQDFSTGIALMREGMALSFTRQLWEDIVTLVRVMITAHKLDDAIKTLEAYLRSGDITPRILAADPESTLRLRVSLPFANQAYLSPELRSLIFDDHPDD